ncbi:hypothetical protein J2Z66_003721 [Paenibacillus eucommiae]|uniref:Uncharacterized protein n=1 Tax=Paenibacillus eucommiae TaxID=1355755 RepID=A0ABS4IX67_9BACL|nr:hypothetical protein [Paenibacillus eucommiae]
MKESRFVCVTSLINASKHVGEGTRVVTIAYVHDPF